MACRPLFRRSGFLFVLNALWPLTFFKHGYDGYHEASLVNSCAFGDDIAENKASNFASCPWNHNRLTIRIARGKGYFSSRVNYHSCSVSGFHLIRLFINGDVCLNPGPDKCENCGQATTRNHGCLSAPRSIRRKAMFLKDYVVENQIDLLAITETWLDLNNQQTANIINELCSLGFAFMHIPRINNCGGGVGLLYNKCYKIEKQDATSFLSFEYMEVLLRTPATVLRIGVLYRHPPSSENGLTATICFSTNFLFCLSV